MKRQKYLIILLILTLTFSCFGCKDQSRSTSSNDGKIGALDQYIGMTMDEFAKSVGQKPDVQPNSNYFQVMFGDTLVYGNLSQDVFKKDVLGDDTQYIQVIHIQLPFDNPAGIDLNDTIKAASQKLEAAGIEYTALGEDYVRYNYDGFINDISFDNEGELADQIGCMGLFWARNTLKWNEDTFRYYCGLAPGGCFMQDGDYVVALDKGLLRIDKDLDNYYFYQDTAGGSVAESSGEIVYTDKDGHAYKVCTNGLILDMSDPSDLAREFAPTGAESADAFTAVAMGESASDTSNGNSDTAKSGAKRIAIEDYLDWDGETTLKNFGKPVAENYDGKGGNLYNDLITQEFINTFNRIIYTISVSSDKYSIFGFYVGMSENEVIAKIKANNGEQDDYHGYVYKVKDSGILRQVSIQCEYGEIFDLSMDTSPE